MVASRVSVEIVAVNNTKEGLGQARDDIKGFNERIRSSTAVDLSVNVAKLEQSLDRARGLLKQAKKDNDAEAEVVIRADITRLQQELTQAKRELRNFARTGEADVSVLGNLFNNVTSSIDRTRLEILKLGGSTTALDAIQKEAEQIRKSFEEGKLTAQQFGVAMSNIEKNSNSIKEVAQGGTVAVGGLKNAVNGLVASLAPLAIAMGAFQFFKTATNNAIEFEAQMANIHTVMQDQTIESMNELGQEVLSLSQNLGISKEAITSATYDMASGGVQMQDMAGMMELMGKASVASGAQMQTVFAGTSAIVKNYGLSFGEAQVAVDMLFMANKQGQTTMEELAPAFQQMAATANLAGVSMEELGAIQGTFTGVTGTASEVATQFTAVVASILKPSQEGAELAKQYNIELSDRAIKEKGLVGVLKEVAEKTNGNKEAMFKMLGSQEAVKLAAAATGAQIKQFDKNLEEHRNALGSTDAALAKNTDTTKRNLQRGKEMWNAFTISVGDYIQAGIDNIFTFVANNSEAFKAIGRVLVGAAKVAWAFIQDFSQFLADGGTNVLVFASNAVQYVKNAFKNLANVFSIGIEVAGNIISTGFREISSKGFGGIVKTFLAFGQNLAGAVVNGLANLPGMVANAIRSALGSIPGAEDLLNSWGIGKVGKLTLIPPAVYDNTMIDFSAFGETISAGMSAIGDSIEPIGPGDLIEPKTLQGATKTMNALNELFATPNIGKLGAKGIGNVGKGGSENTKESTDITDTGKPKGKGGGGGKGGGKGTDNTQDLRKQAQDEVDLNLEKQKKIFTQAKKSQEDIKKLEEDALLAKKQIDIDYAKTEEDKVEAKRNYEIEKEKIETNRIERTQEAEKKSAEEKKKLQEDVVKEFVKSYDTTDDAIAKSKEKIVGYQDEIGKIATKWKETTAEVRGEIRKINQSISETNFGADKKLADRFIKLEDEIAKQEQAKTGTNVDPEKIKQAEEAIAKAKAEQALIQKELNPEELQKARDEASKTEAQKIIDERDAQIKSFEERKALAQAFATSSLEEKKVQVTEEGDVIKATYTDEKGQIQEVKDLKNIAYAEELAKKQLALQESLAIKQKEITDENTIITEGLAKREEIYKSFFAKIKKEGLDAITAINEANKSLLEGGTLQTNLPPVTGAGTSSIVAGRARGTTGGTTSTSNRNVNIGTIQVNNNVDLDSTMNVLNNNLN